MASSDSQYKHGMDIPIATPATRVVSLVPSLTESLFDLNLGNRIVGITDYCTRPADKLVHLPRVGGVKNPNLEHILALQPDLVFASQEENSKSTVEALQAAGIPVWVTFPKTVPDVFNLLWNIMDVFDEATMVPRVRLMEYTYDWVSNSVKTQRGAPSRVFAPIWFDPIMTITADTYAHDLIEVCGGRNVFADYHSEGDDAEKARYPQVTLAEVVAAQPEVILLPDEPYKFTEDDRARFATLDVPATHNQRIYLVDGSLLTWPGTRVVYALTDLPPLLAPTLPDGSGQICGKVGK